MNDCTNDNGDGSASDSGSYDGDGCDGHSGYTIYFLVGAGFFLLSVLVLMQVSPPSKRPLWEESNTRWTDDHHSGAELSAPPAENIQ